MDHYPDRVSIEPHPTKAKLYYVVLTTDIASNSKTYILCSDKTWATKLQTDIFAKSAHCNYII